jgi:hypothetical protein
MAKLEWKSQNDSKPVAPPVPEKFYPDLPQIKAEDLEDKTFIIRELVEREKTMQRDGKTETSRFFICLCANPETGELWTSALGGNAVLEAIEAHIQAGTGEPLIGTLKKEKSQSSGRKYWVFQ